MAIELEGTIEEKLRLIIPDNIKTLDKTILDFAESTLSNETVEYTRVRTNRTTQMIYKYHEIDIRNIIRALLSLVSNEGRGYIRLLDLGCGERLFSPNRCVFFKNDDEDKPYVDNYVYFGTERPAIRVFSLDYLPVLEFGFDNGHFYNPIADEKGLFRLDYMNKVHRRMFEEVVPEGYFDFVISTAFFGHGTNSFLKLKYVSSTKENLGWIEKFLNPSYGVFSIVTSNSDKSSIPSVTAEYTKPELSHSETFYYTGLSKHINLKEFRWDICIASLKALDKVSNPKYPDITPPELQILMYE